MGNLCPSLGGHAGVTSPYDAVPLHGAGGGAGHAGTGGANGGMRVRVDPNGDPQKEALGVLARVLGKSAQPEDETERLRQDDESFWDDDDGVEYEQDPERRQHLQGRIKDKEARMRKMAREFSHKMGETRSKIQQIQEEIDEMRREYHRPGTTNSDKQWCRGQLSTLVSNLTSQESRLKHMQLVYSAACDGENALSRTDATMTIAPELNEVAKIIAAAHGARTVNEFEISTTDALRNPLGKFTAITAGINNFTGSLVTEQGQKDGSHELVSKNMVNHAVEDRVDELLKMGMPRAEEEEEEEEREEVRPAARVSSKKKPRPSRLRADKKTKSGKRVQIQDELAGLPDTPRHAPMDLPSAPTKPLTPPDQAVNVDNAALLL